MRPLRSYAHTPRHDIPGHALRHMVAEVANYCDGVQPDSRIGNDILEHLRVRPHFLVEFPRSSDCSWYCDLLHSTEIAVHAAPALGCAIEVKGRCLLPALFPELGKRLPPNCGHGQAIVLGAHQRHKIMNGVSEAVLHAADISPAIDKLLASGRYQMGHDVGRSEILLASVIDTFFATVLNPVRARMERCNQYLLNPAELLPPINVGRPTGVDLIAKQMVRAQSVLTSVERLPRSHAWFGSHWSSPMDVQPLAELHQWLDTDGAVAMAQAVSKKLTDSVSGVSATPVILVREKSAQDLYESGDREGALRMCMADVAATCARCWYELHPSNDPKERIRSLVHRFGTVVFNGEVLQAH